MGPYQRTPKRVARAIRYSGLGVCSVGPVGDFLDWKMFFLFKWVIFRFHVSFRGCSSTLLETKRENLRENQENDSPVKKWVDSPTLGFQTPCEEVFGPQKHT